VRRNLSEGFTRSIPRIIWTYWHDPQIPPKVEKILKEREEVLVTWEHRLLNEETVYDYIPREEFPVGYHILGHQHKADWIRLYLLKTYAGCWMDATIIVNRTDELEQLYERSLIEQSDLTAYYHTDRLLDNNPRSFIENFFLLAPVGSSLIARWYDEYTLAIGTGLIEYKKRVFSKVNVRHIYKKDNDDVYFSAYACLQSVITENDKIILTNAFTSVYTYHDECRWDSQCVVNKIKRTPKQQQPDSIKLIRGDREYL
jgi:hypothetical protein